MNDDITVRELELVVAILDDLYGRCIDITDSDLREGTYMEGYVDAIEIVNEVLDKRGFDPGVPNRLSGGTNGY